MIYMINLTVKTPLLLTLSDIVIYLPVLFHPLAKNDL